MIRRLGLFFLVNMAIIITISIITSALGLNRYVSSQGIDYQMLLGFCLVWGMAGSFISLMLSKQMAKWGMRLQVIGNSSRSQDEAWLYQTVQRLSRGAKLPKMPEVAIYDSPELNAFATGPSKSNSLVAVSTGLLHGMSRDEVEAVLAHEVSHVANGDMVTMTLIQGVINAFVMFFAKIVAWGVANAMRSNDDEGPSYMLAFVVEMACYVVFGLLGSLVVNWFSRQREFRADAGAAKLSGSSKMINALQRLKSGLNIEAGDQPKEMASLKISGGESWMALLSTHPSLDDRISRLKNA